MPEGGGGSVGIGHGADVLEDRPWRRLDGHQIVERTVAVDVGGRDQR